MIFNLNVLAKDIDNLANSKWANLHLYHGENQRGGPYGFDDTYVEFEFGGRYE